MEAAQNTIQQTHTVSIPVSGGKYHTLVDSDDAQLVRSFSWNYVNKGGGRVYAIRSVWENKDNRTLYLHRELLRDVPAGYDVDHRNGNTLDNTRANLRIATRAQNNANAKKPSHNTSGFKGVCFRKDRRRFKAYIKVAQKQIALGCFDTAEEAAHAYDRASLELHGEFARLNFPQ